MNKNSNRYNRMLKDNGELERIEPRPAVGFVQDTPDYIYDIEGEKVYDKWYKNIDFDKIGKTAGNIGQFIKDIKTSNAPSNFRQPQIIPAPAPKKSNLPLIIGASVAGLLLLVLILKKK